MYVDIQLLEMYKHTMRTFIAYLVLGCEIFRISLSQNKPFNKRL